MADSKSEALLKAAQTGRVDNIRQLLQAGASVEATDINRFTPIMLAAQWGHLDAVLALAQAGANLHALAFRQVDLLEVAAQGGNIEIVCYLLKRGLPVNGHWQPLNDVLRKMGHDTPLIKAADSGNVETVRILLEAGADRNAKHQGQTALDLIQERLADSDCDDFKEEYQQIAALLGAVPAKKSQSAGSILEEVKKFAANARRPEYVELCEKLVSLCGEGRSWKPLTDHGVRAAKVVAFTLRDCKRQKTLNDLHKDSLVAGCHLILAEPWTPGEAASLVLFPTENRFAVVASVGTEGANHGVTNSKLIGWLESLDGENPFRLVICNHEMIGGSFIGSVKGAPKLAERIAEFCPSIFDEEIGDSESLAIAIKKSKSFLLRWD